MRNILLYIMVCTATLSCQDHIDLYDLQSANRLVVYAFPTAGDTLEIQVSACQPTNGKPVPLACPQVDSFTNGKMDSVELVGDTLVEGLSVYEFRAIGRHAYGDHISIRAVADGFSEAMGETDIPSPIDVGRVVTDTVWYNGGVYTQLRLTFRDAEIAQYYAVRVKGYNVEDGSRVFLDVETGAEPVLNNYSSARPDFDAWNDYYQKMYTFDDSSFQNNEITLRLNILQQSWLTSLYPQLFVLSNEYYKMLKSLNSVRNNDLANYGLSFAYSTYSNVSGGYGCVAGYAMAR